MSEEAAFLEALKANPADDTTRLVYADWLDEHGEPTKAEYLRLVAELARECDDLASHPHGQRICALAESVPQEWRDETGARFVVTLFSYDYPFKINVIKLLREITGCGLGEAKAMSESLPCRVIEPRTFEHAQAAVQSLQQVPVTLVSILPTERESLPYSVKYEVYLLRYRYFMTSVPGTQTELASLEARTQFLTAIGKTGAEEELNPHAAHTLLASDLTPDEANARVKEWRAHLPPSIQLGYLWVGARHVPIKKENSQSGV